MDIKDYVYDKETFQENAINALKAKNEADRALTEVEERQKKGDLILTEYYKAYSDYIETDNAHMKTFLDYLKYYYDAMTHFANETQDQEYCIYAITAKEYFDKYYELYEKLHKAEMDYKKTLQDVNNASAMMDYATKIKTVHLSLMRCDIVHLQTHTEVELLRENQILPFMEECDKLIPEKAFESEGEPNA